MRKKEIWLYGNFHMGRSGKNASGTKKLSKINGTFFFSVNFKPKQIFFKDTILSLHVLKLFCICAMESGGSVQFWYDAGVILMKYMAGGTSAQPAPHRARPAAWHPPLALQPAQPVVA